MNVYIVNGKPGCGKTTFQNIMKLLMGDKFCFSISSIDWVKTIAKACGWTGAKEQKDRKFLADLKHLLNEYNDSPFKEVVYQVRSIERLARFHEFEIPGVAVFIDVREPEEIKRYCEELSAKSLLVRREDVEAQSYNNPSDTNVFDYTYDITIDNNESLTSLVRTCYQFAYSEKLHIEYDSLKVDLFGQIKRPDGN